MMSLDTIRSLQLARNLKRYGKEPGFDPIAYKKKWYEVGRRVAASRNGKSN